MRNIKTVTILGANGSMGSHCAGIISGFGNAKIFMIGRNLKKAKMGILAAKDSIKSNVIEKQLIPKTYANLPECISQSDWVFELITENSVQKTKLNLQVAKYLKPNTIISTVSSGLSITNLSKSFSLAQQKNYFGTHFYNPPYKMLLCELISNPNSDPKTKTMLSSYLTHTLQRIVVETNDTPGFAGNRIGFQFINEAAWFAHKYESRGGIAYIDELLGGLIGHTMPPLATIDLVGIDVHKAIVDNLYQNTNDEAHITFKMPPFLQHLISLHYLGTKTGRGLYNIENNHKMVLDTKTLTYKQLPKFNIDFVSHAKNLISEGLYSNAIKLILHSSGTEANIIQHFIARYISYSLSLVGPVVKTKEDIDMVMGYGFGWLPPCALIDLLGGKKPTAKLIESFNFVIPKIISQHKTDKPFYTLQNQLDYRSFIRSN